MKSIQNVKPHNQPRSGQNQLPEGGIYIQLPKLALFTWLKKIILGLQKLFISLKYKVYLFETRYLLRFRLNWFKLVVGVFAVYVFAKKEVHFSVNMRSPLVAEQPQQKHDLLSIEPSKQLAHTVSFKGQTTATAQAVNWDFETEEVNYTQQAVQAYINRFSKVAVAEMNKFGIPASIKIAQGILESGAGRNSSARQTNNHFGGPLAGKSYTSAWENWRAHSLLIQTEYPRLFKNGHQYKKWAMSLEKSGYNTDSKYAEKLIELIENYQLHLLDEA